MKNWEKKKLSELCDLITKGTTPTSIGYKFTNEGINFIKVESLTESGEIIPNKVAYINEECHQTLKRSQLKTNDILFSIAGALGRIGIVRDETIPANTNQALAIIRLKNNSGVLVNYLAKYFNSNLISDEIEKLQGGAAQQNLSLTQLNNLEIPLPPLPEQKRIVAILDEAFAAIAKAKANAEQNLKNAKELFESYLQGVLENKGEDWEEKKLGEVYDVRDGTHDSPKYQEEGFPLITSKNLKKDLLNYDNVNYISEQDYISINKRSKVDKGDILLAMIGTIGNPVVIQNEPNFAIKNVALFKTPKGQSSNFLKYYLDAKSTIDKMIGDAKGTTQKFVGLGYLRGFKILFPPFEEQQTIVQKLDAFSAETKKLEAIYQKKIYDLEELKKSFLQKAFAGELQTKK